MPRSSRHKSSKHSSKDVKDYSDSEKDSSSKDKRSREEVSARVSKDSSSGDKRKFDLKDGKGVGNGEHAEGHGSSKRRREKGDDGTADRWNGGGDHDRGEGWSSKVSGDAKNKRNDDNVGVVGDSEVGKKNAGKDGRHRESSRKDAGAEREKKGREGRNNRVVDSENPRTKDVVENTASVVEHVLLRSESKNQTEGSIRKEKDGSVERNKCNDVTGGVNDRHSKDDYGKDRRQKSEKVKDDKHKEKYLDDMDKESKHRDDKQRDKRTEKNHGSSRFDDRRLKDEKHVVDIEHQKNKTRDSDRDRDRDHNGKRDWDLDSMRDRDRELDCRHYQDQEDDRKRGRDRSRDRSRDRDYDRDSEWDRDLERDRKHSRVDYDGSNMDDRSSKHRRSREKKRSPDGCDDYSDVKAISVRAHRSDVEKKSSSIDRADYHPKRARSQARSSHTDEYSHPESEDMKYRDSVQEQASKATYSRELTGSSGALERGSKYRSMEKLTKTDDGHFGEPFNERSSSSKASPLGLVDRSPSSASNDRRHRNRTAVKRSLDIEETGRRSMSIDMREFSIVEERVNRDLPLEKPHLDESSQAESSFYRVGQGGSSSLGPPAFRSGVDSPSFVSVEDNSRANSAGRYRRNSDPNAGRMHGNAWRGVVNWTAPMSNGFIPFQHGPHGGFQPMVPQFPTPPLFVRPLEINHSGMPYHISDVERFSSPFRPLGWQTMMDGSGPSNLHGWDGNNGVFRDDPLVYRGAEWDQNGTMKNGRGWESSAVWNGQNSDIKTDSASPSDKDDLRVHAHGDMLSAGPVNEMFHPEDGPRGLLLKPTDFTSNAVTPVKDNSTLLPEPVSEKALSPKTTRKNSSFLSRIYLSKIEISADLTHPELYNQCMNILETEQSLIAAAADDDDSSRKLSKMDARAGPGSSKITRNPSPFPPVKDFVFKRAMDLYKKQMMKERNIVFISNETIDIKSPASDEIIREQAAIASNPVSDVEMTEAIDSKLENSEEKEADEITDLNESIQELEDNENPDEKLEKIKNPEGGGNENPPSGLLGEGEEDQIGVAEKPADDGLNKGPIFPEELEALMPDSVIISRIHHSPESTH